MSDDKSVSDVQNPALELIRAHRKSAAEKAAIRKAKLAEMEKSCEALFAPVREVWEQLRDSPAYSWHHIPGSADRRRVVTLKEHALYATTTMLSFRDNLAGEGLRIWARVLDSLDGLDMQVTTKNFTQHVAPEQAVAALVAHCAKYIILPEDMPDDNRGSA